MFLTSIGTPLSRIKPDAEEIRQREDQIRAEKERISSDRPGSSIERIKNRGRMTAEERVRALCDDHNPWFLNEFPGADRPAEGRAKPWRLGVICALGTICGRKGFIIANDNTVTAGSWWPGTPEKIVHAMNMARRLRIPVFYLIECAGLYLPHQDQTFAGPHGAGDIFQTQAQLNRAGILQVAAIFGDCIAGGGYMPLLCDKIVMTEQATICIGGNAITSHSRGGAAEPIGTPSVHVHLSGCAECRVPDDQAAIDKLREWTACMPSSAADFYRLDEPLDSPFDIEELYHLLPADTASSFDMVQVIARLVDGGQVQKLFENTGREIIAALGIFDGLPAVVIANRAENTISASGQPQAGGILYRDGITKIRKVVENANSDGIPVIWLQDVAGFDIGYEAEKAGLLRHGAMLLRELSADFEEVPAHLTIVLRKASGAGYYAMKGAPFHPAMTLATAVSRIEVMSPETLAGTLFDKKIAGMGLEDPRRGVLEAQKRETIELQVEASKPQQAAMRGDVDDVIELGEMRARIVEFLKAAWQNPRSVKPVRLWRTLES